MKRIFVLISAMLLSLAMYSATAGAEIRIGVVGPMSGPYAAFGRQIWRGADMAIKEINAAGGVNGEPIKLVIGDDRCDVAKAAGVAQMMAAKKVSLVIGHFCGGTSIEASRVYAREKIIQIEPAATNPVLTERRPGPGVFRVVPSDRQQAAFAGAYIAMKFAGKKIAMVSDDSNYGASLALAVRKSIEAAGQALTVSETYTGGQDNFSSLVANLKASRPDVAYASGYLPELALLLLEMRRQDVTAQLIAPDALASPEFWRIAGSAGEGTLMSFMPDPRGNAAAAEIVNKFRAAKIEPEGYTLHAYVAAKLWTDAAKTAGSFAFDEVVGQLNKIEATTAIGKVSFDENGDLIEPHLVWYVWHNGRYAPVDEGAN